jgi:hypothetical protein
MKPGVSSLASSSPLLREVFGFRLFLAFVRQGAAALARHGDSE